MSKYKIGILAYGSLIDEPGPEIEPLIVERIACVTPFKVEYARKSRTRGDAPTLIPFDKIGKMVNAVILVLDNLTNLDEAKSMLYRRETRKIGTDKIYEHSKNPSENKTQVEIINNFMKVGKVLYTKLGSNIHNPIDADLLSNLAIESILTVAGERKKDGIRYLLYNNKNKIVTQLSIEYEKQILLKTKSGSLDEAISKMDLKRQSLTDGSI